MKKVYFKYLLLTCLIYSSSAVVFAQDWKKIALLKTTRTEIEKVFGNSSEPNCSVCKYTTSEGILFITYSEQKCRGDINGWNVPPDTVLTFSLIHKEGQFLKIPKSEKDQFIKFSSDVAEEFIIDAQKGIKYVVNNGELIKTTFLPTEKDNYLRCKGFPHYNPAGVSYIPLTSFSHTDINEVKARISNDFTGLYSDEKAYLILYSGDNLKGKEFEDYFNIVNNHIYKKLKLPKSKVFLINGGKRKKFEGDIFIVMKKYPPPVPSPKN